MRDYVLFLLTAILSVMISFLSTESFSEIQKLIAGVVTMSHCLASKKIVLIADARVLSIPIHENHERMIDLRDAENISYGEAPWGLNNHDYTKIRETIYQKLIQAQALLPDGLKFQLYEGYRSLQTQQNIFDDRYARLKKENPKFTHDQLFIESTKFVSPVINLDGTRNIPPHSTGPAIDVYLVDKHGKPVDMGISLDDSYQDLKGIYCQTNSQAISSTAKKYRAIMNAALTSVGFANYPTEYWHWSYGDRYWAFQTKHKFAVYGGV